MSPIRLPSTGDTRPGAPATIVAVEDGVIAGFATTGPARDAPGAGELLALYVEPERWGRGVAQRCYRAEGWHPDGGRREEVVWGVRADEIRYLRSVPRQGARIHLC